MVSPTAAEAGKVIVQALEVVLIQYPFPETALKVAPVTIEDCQAIEPNPVAVPLLAKVAPAGIVIVSPEAPMVIVLAFSLIMLLPSLILDRVYFNNTSHLNSML
jgi:hypothetical protein